jgi:hypothetical protein
LTTTPPFCFAYVELHLKAIQLLRKFAFSVDPPFQR